MLYQHNTENNNQRNGENSKLANFDFKNCGTDSSPSVSTLEFLKSNEQLRKLFRNKREEKKRKQDAIAIQETFEQEIMAHHDYTWIDSLLNEMNKMLFTKSSFGDEIWKALRLVIEELENLRTFAICCKGESSSRSGMSPCMIDDDVCDFEAELRKATSELRRASNIQFGKGRRAKRLGRAILKLKNIIACFRPKIITAYDYASSQFFLRFHWDTRFLCRELLNSVYEDLSSSLHRGRGNGEFLLLDTSMKVSLAVLVKIHASFISFLDEILPRGKGSSGLLGHCGSVLVRVAYFSYCWCWANDADDDQNQVDRNLAPEMVIHLVREVIPGTPVAVEMCVQALRLKASKTKDAARHFVHFLIPEVERDHLLAILDKGLTWLITFLIDAPDLYLGDNEVELLSRDITAVASEIGSLSHLFYITTCINDNQMSQEEDMVAAEETTNQETLFKLLEKVEILKVEVLLVEIKKLVELQTELKARSINMDLKYLRWIHKDVNDLKRREESIMNVSVEDRIDSVHEGLTFMRSFLVQSSQPHMDVENKKTIWTDAEALVMEASSVYNSFYANSTTKDVATYEIVKFRDKIRFFKLEFFLMELINIHPSLIMDVKDQIRTLCEGLIFIRTFLRSPSDEIGELVLIRVESVTRDVGFLCYSLSASCTITEDQINEMIILLPELVDNIKQARAEIKESYLQIRRSSQSNFPKNTGLGFVEFLLGNLGELLTHKTDTIASLKHDIEVIYREMENFLRSFPRDITEHGCDDHSDLNNIHSDFVNVAYEVEYLIDSFVVESRVLWYHMLWLSDLIEEIKLINNRVSEISMKRHGVILDNANHALRNVMSTASAPDAGEFVVDLDDQATLMTDRLISGSSQQDVVSIVGMPGLGKTTLAKKLYNDPSVTYHFHIRAWCCVSHMYQKRKLLLDLLSNIVEITDDILEMTDDDLDFKLYQCLKQRRYLIVLDDLWSIEAWNDLKASLPDDKNGSRILITSRLPDVASETRPDSKPHHLRLLCDDESWQLLQEKLFQKEDCPDELAEIGKQIAKSCKGLPLAIVAISGLLQRTDKTQDWWNQVAESLSSHIADDPETRCMDILELSYKHLPNHLKPCFLYVGAFVADQEIQVWKLMCLWIAEGFIQNTKLKSLEVVAEEYLKDLIGRSLIMASKRRSNGGVKTCRVHDMLRAMCLMRCKEENFMQVASRYDEHFDSSIEDLDYGVDSNYYPSSFIRYQTLRVSICSKRNHLVMLRPSGPQVRSLLFFATSDTYPRCPYNISFIPRNFKLLRVLDLECINMGNSFPFGIELLVHLRYLAICGDIDSIPASIANFWNLQTLIVKGLKGKVELPNSIWSMESLRHIHVRNQAAISFQDYKHADSSQLHNLVTLSTPTLYGKDTEKIMRMLLKLRKLSCIFSQSQDDIGNPNEFPVLDFLMELESLKVMYSGRIPHPRKFEFPLRLKKLSLSKFRLPWDYISEIGKLPNLEVLKLLSRSFEGKIWDMREGEFPKLKFLKLDSLNIAQWNASSDHLPMLQRLVLRNCRQLEMVPSEFGEIVTLDIIEVQLCRTSVEESVRRIKEEQVEMGNQELQVLINGSSLDFSLSS